MDATSELLSKNGAPLNMARDCVKCRTFVPVLPTLLSLRQIIIYPDIDEGILSFFRLLLANFYPDMDQGIFRGPPNH